MMRHLISLVIAFSVVPLAFAQERVKQPTPEEIARREAKAAEDAKAKALLDRVLPAINFSNVNLSDAFDFLRDVSGANIHVNWKAIEKASVTRDTIINLKMRQVSLAKLLDLVLLEASGNAKLGWAIDEGVIEISTAEVLAANVVIKIYEVRDLLDPRALDQKGATLSTMITLSIAPNSWREKGGHGAIKYSDGKLVITQTNENHEAIKNLLDGLRELRK